MIAVSPGQVAFHIRRAPKRSERQGNPSLRGGFVVLCLKEGLLDVCLKSHIG